MREAVAADGRPGRAGYRWAVPLGAAATVVAAACVPVVWPLLAGGVGAGGGAVAAALGQVGGVGGGLLAEAVIRAWDRLRSGKDGQGESGGGPEELRVVLAAELERALGSPSGPGLRAEVAGVMRAVDAVQVALTATIDTAVGGSGERVRAELTRGLGELGAQFAEFRWLLVEVDDQIAGLAESQAVIAAGTRATLDNTEQALMHLTLLRQEMAPLRDGGAGGDQPQSARTPAGGEHAGAPEEAGVQVSGRCPYPGLAAFGPQDAGVFFGREEQIAVLAARLAELCARPGLLAVIGPSGSGKSSLLRAGLLPAIAGGAVPVRGSRAWPMELLTPGAQPLLELATRLASLAGVPAGALEADLRTDPGRITAAIGQALHGHARRQAYAAGGAAPPAALMAAAGSGWDGGPCAADGPGDGAGTGAAASPPGWC